MTALWRVARVAVVAGSTFLLAACGSCGSTPSATTSPGGESPAATTSSGGIRYTTANACTLVTADDASTATGKTMASSTGGIGATVPGACVYASADGATSILVYTQVYPDTSAADSVQPDTLATTLGAAFGVSNAKNVTGIGDKAVEYTSATAGSGGALILVFKANVLIMVIESPASDTSVVESLAKTAVSRLKV